MKTKKEAIDLICSLLMKDFLDCYKISLNELKSRGGFIHKREAYELAEQIAKELGAKENG